MDTIVENVAVENIPKIKRSSGRKSRGDGTEDDLGIYEDTAECNGLSDSEDSENSENEKEGEPQNEEETAIETTENKMSDDNTSNLKNDDEKNEKTEDHEEVVKIIEPEVTILNSEKSAEKPDGAYIGQVSFERDRLDITSSFDINSGLGFRGKANTPSNLYVEQLKASQGIESRATSRFPSGCRDEMYHRAMTLLTSRCAEESTLSGVKPPSYEDTVPEYLYVRQSHPVPMPPLKAWRGYNGNVYFEPIQVSSLSMAGDGRTQETSLDKCSERLQKIILSRGQKNLANRKTGSVSSRSVSRQTNKGGFKSRPTTRQMVMLDKRSILNRFNDNLEEDLKWLEGQESVGSLSVTVRRDKAKENQTSSPRDRICKGSVAHQLHVNKKDRARPLLLVNGDKFTPPSVMSPLLRTQTQYSQSSQRLTMNSPDIYHGFNNYEKLPPLEQLRASLRHMDNTRDDPYLSNRASPYGRPMTVSEELKPFIKYSPDIKKQVQYG